MGPSLKTPIYPRSRKHATFACKRLRIPTPVSERLSRNAIMRIPHSVLRQSEPAISRRTVSDNRRSSAEPALVYG